MSNYTIINGELYHYGVKGMKWGRRKNYKTLGNRFHSRSAKKIQADADNLRKHGYKEEADAVQKVADKKRAKAAASQAKYESIQRGKQLSKQLTDRSKIRWNEDYNERLISKMSDKDWEDVKNYEKSESIKSLVSTSLMTLAGVSIVALMELKN